MGGRSEGLGRALTWDEARQRERVRQRLAAVGERCRDNLLDVAEVSRKLLPSKRDKRGIDVRRRLEDPPGDGMESGALGGELDEHRDGAVVLCPRTGKEAVGNLALNHHAPEPNVRQSIEALDDQRRGDVVREVRHELRRVLRQLELEGVAESYVDVFREAAERRLERVVDLDRVDAADSLGEVTGEHSLPGPDLEHDVFRPELREPADHLEDVRVAQEVLPVRLLGPRAHGSEKHSVAFRSICCSSSAGSARRARARAASVWTTFAGSFRRPRTGCGARYGESVSTRMRRGGTSVAASRRSTAFGKVAFPAKDTYQSFSW